MAYQVIVEYPGGQNTILSHRDKTVFTKPTAQKYAKEFTAKFGNKTRVIEEGEPILRYAKQNPAPRAPKRKTAARTIKAATAYVKRPSQITKKAPTKRLATRRIKNLQVPRGVFPNPAKRTASVVVEKMTQGLWNSVAFFPGNAGGIRDAKEYARALSVKFPDTKIRVTK